MGGGVVSPVKAQRLRTWLEYVVETAIEMLDALDAGDADREDDELGDDDAMPEPLFGGGRR